MLFRRYAGRHVYLFLDNCSIHDSKLVRRFLADHQDRITLIWNATYCPELNLIERYWGHLKATATNNYLFGSAEALRQAVRQAVCLMNRSRTRRMKLHVRFLQRLRGAA
jgi:transposase